MRTGLILGVLAVTFMFPNNFAVAAVTTSVAYKVSVTIPEIVGTANQKANALSVSGPDIKESLNSESIVEETIRNNQPIILQTIVVK